MRPRGLFLVVAFGLLAGSACERSGAPGEAAGAPQQGLREAVRLHGMALAKMEEGDFATAARHLERVAEILPDNALPPINLALCAFGQGDVAGALAHIRRARELVPDNPQMLFTLAKILEARPDSEAEWESVVDHFAETHPYDPRPPYLRAVHLESAGRSGEAVGAWARTLELAPDNLVAMAGLLHSAAAAGDLEHASDALYAIEDRLGGFTTPLDEFARELRAALDAGDRKGLAVPAVVLENILRPSDLYQVGLDALAGRRTPVAQLFPQLDFVPPLPRDVQGGRDIAFRFDDAGSSAGLDRLTASTALFAARVPGRDDVLDLAEGRLGLLSLEDGAFSRSELGVGSDLARFVLHADLDQDEVNDLVLLSGRGLLFLAGDLDGGFAEPQMLLGPEDSRDVAAVLPVDIDHEGDLDLFVARLDGPDRYLQNNGNRSWTERAAELGIDGGEGATTAAVSADFDDDGDLDLITAHGRAGLRLYLNRRAGRLVDASADYRLEKAPEATGLATADFDGDGRMDLLTWGAEGGSLLRNGPLGEFETEPLEGPPGADAWACAALGDYDNDGDVDVVACLRPQNGAPALAFLRNHDGELRAEQVGLGDVEAVSLRSGDFDGDGDLDLLAAAAEGGDRFWENDGGNRNHFLRLTLRGKNDSNAKNNTQGFYSRIETRVGGSYQAFLGNGGVNHIGLGAYRQADILRVVWTNGLSQTWEMMAADRTVTEEQVLKGSCPFLYTWDGKGFRFHTDLMWRSPLGMVLDDGSAAPHRSARDFVRIPGDRLRPVEGRLWLQVTEELWETIYLDRAWLMAVDHPSEYTMLVDEKFHPDFHPSQPPIHWIDRRLSPVAAEDDRGRDMLEKIRAVDGVHVDGLPTGRYQGLTREHYLDLTFEDVPPGERLRLILWGWIFPTDTSINVALSQNPDLATHPPSLELLGEDGEWRTIVPFLGFPSGKRKSVVADLTDLLPPGRVRLRLTTNLEVYWDAAALAVGEPGVRPVTHRMEATLAHLHPRGFSRLYRESPSGPHLFDYASVDTGPRFRDMTGAYTRFGAVEELLTREDDRYVVMTAGDELTLRFDEPGPGPPPGWTRDYVLYTDGWVKDADINTTASQSAEPWPYHGMRSYPDTPTHRYPMGDEQREFLERYQTRQVDDAAFRNLLRHPAAEKR